MQWIHSACIHTGEYFHGPFEITDCNAGFVVQIAEGSGRELDERCLRFLQKYAKRFEVLDAKELGLVHHRPLCGGLLQPLPVQQRLSHL